jgi:hypothetical protein
MRNVGAVWTALIATIGVALGSFLPWATWGPISANGTSGDGVITLLAGALAFVGVLLYFKRPNVGRLVRTIVPVGLLIALATSVYDAINISSTSVSVFGTNINETVGIGLWLVVLGSIVGAIAWGYERFHKPVVETATV